MSYLCPTMKTFNDLIFTKHSNGIAGAVFDLGSGETQVFNYGDLTISKLEFANIVSGGSTTAIQILASVKSVCQS